MARTDPSDTEGPRLNAHPSTDALLVHRFDDFQLDEFLDVAAEFGSRRYGFVVTPNVDHLIRCHEDPGFNSCYACADFVLLDSRIAARLLRFFKGLRLAVCPGSDLTAALFAKVIVPADRIVLVGADAQQVQQLVGRYALSDIRHHNPPMGFIKNPRALEDCLKFIEQASPFRFCFIAVGSPQQERVAELLRRRGTARGLALCVGASLNFLTGREQRAPHWMQTLCLEWFYRLVHDPKRLWNRYLVRGPRILTHLRRSTVIVRSPSSAR